MNRPGCGHFGELVPVEELRSDPPHLWPVIVTTGLRCLVCDPTTTPPTPTLEETR